MTEVKSREYEELAALEVSLAFWPALAVVAPQACEVPLLPLADLGEVLEEFLEHAVLPRHCPNSDGHATETSHRQRRVGSGDRIADGSWRHKSTK